MFLLWFFNVLSSLQVLNNYTPPAPITAPIMSPLGEPQAPAAPTQPPQPGLQAPYNPHMRPTMAPGAGPPTMQRMNVEGAPGAPTGDIIQVLLLDCIHISCAFTPCNTCNTLQLVIELMPAFNLKKQHTCFTQHTASDTHTNTHTHTQGGFAQLTLCRNGCLVSLCRRCLRRRSLRSPSRRSTWCSRSRLKDSSRNAWPPLQIL